MSDSDWEETLRFQRYRADPCPEPTVGKIESDPFELGIERGEAGVRELAANEGVAVQQMRSLARAGFIFASVRRLVGDMHSSNDLKLKYF
ncbi:MAG: hypothetical protein Q7T94_10455 [Rugosibacter sp.]|jgi:hypothetical protein|nr:hypothetical protein [Rugosibacter sp.]